MTDDQLLTLKGKLCMFRHGPNELWRHGVITAVMSEIVSIDGYPFSREGLEAEVVGESGKPLEPDMTASELSAFLEDIHQRYDAGRE